jgi:phosphate starvation-inducible membrane PsiE
MKPASNKSVDILITCHLNSMDEIMKVPVRYFVQINRTEIMKLLIYYNNNNNNNDNNKIYTSFDLGNTTIS